jgi:hypothetical protein
MVPYNLPTEPLPVPLFTLWWPTITPLLPPAKRTEAGALWKAETKVQLGAGVFPVAYSIKLVESADQDYTVEVKLDEQYPAAQAGELTLTLHPQGQWSAKIARSTNIWKSCRGQMLFSVRAKFIEDDEPIEVDVLKAQNVFSLEALPVSFDQDKVYTSAWKYHADHPELRAAQPPPPAQPSTRPPPIIKDTKPTASSVGKPR